MPLNAPHFVCFVFFFKRLVFILIWHILCPYMYLTWLAYHQSVGDTTTTDIDAGIKGALAHALLSLSLLQTGTGRAVRWARKGTAQLHWHRDIYGHAARCPLRLSKDDQAIHNANGDCRRRPVGEGSSAVQQEARRPATVEVLAPASHSLVSRSLLPAALFPPTVTCTDRRDDPAL